MRKKSIVLVFLLGLIVVLSGCGTPSTEKIKSDLSKKTNKVESYYALMEMQIKSRESVEKYEAEQWYLAPQNYRVDVGLPHGFAQRFISDGSITHIYEEELEEWFEVDHSADPYPAPPFLLSFYWTNFIDATNLELLGKEKLTQRSYYKVKVTPRDKSSVRQYEIFWLDTETLMPIRIETYDDEGELSAELFFKKIVINSKIEKDVFEVPENEVEEG